MNAFEQGLARYFTPDQLQIIRLKRIGIAGAGGLGSNLSMTLVRCGFRRLEILDKDTVEASNLNRQDFTLDNIGTPKVEALRRRILSVNPDAEIITRPQEWTTGNAGLFFADADIIVEAFDKADMKTAFVEYCATRLNPRRPLVSGNGMAGLNVTTSATALRKVGNIYIVGDGATSIHDGHPPLAPRVLQCAARMAEVVLSLTLSGNS